MAVATIAVPTTMQHRQHRDRSPTTPSLVRNRNSFKYLIPSRELLMRCVLGTMEQLWRMVRLARGRPTPYLERRGCEFLLPVHCISNILFQFLMHPTFHNIVFTFTVKTMRMQGSFNDRSSQFLTKLKSRASQPKMASVFAQQLRPKLPSLKSTTSECTTCSHPMNT
jgi:hypothetical protein